MWSYDRHAEQEKELAGGDYLPACFEQASTIDAWRHRRMLENLLPLIEDSPDSKWITIGDGKFGSDAYFLETHGVDVVATSLSTHTLEVAHSKGYIKKYAAENAEALSLGDNAVDFVLCKESYHHFPRPPVAFYEMLRVSRKAMILIEPIEGPARLLSVAKSFAKRLLRGDVTEQFEVCGNFLYRLTIREIFKMLSALGYGCMAWKGINDFGNPRFALAEYDRISVASLGTRAGIWVQDFLSRTRLLNYGLAAVICFKEKPGTELVARLRKQGFSVTYALVNPFTQK
jgi:ubiquinone/menaquinone biosynthesis C-methylase UbiE